MIGQMFLAIINLVSTTQSSKITLVKNFRELQAQLTCVKAAVNTGISKTRMILQKKANNDQVLSKHLEKAYTQMIKMTKKYETNFMSHSISYLLKNKVVCNHLASYRFTYNLRTGIENYKNVLEMQKQGLIHNNDNFSGLEKSEAEEIVDEFKHAKIQVMLFFDVLLSSYENLVKKIIYHNIR